MAIKIIKAGNPEKLNPTRNFKCYVCDGTFSAQRSDFNPTGDIRDNDYLIKCPTAGCNNHLSWNNFHTDDIPDWSR